MNWLCKIGIHNWEELPRQESQNLAVQLIYILVYPLPFKRYKCKRCGKTK